MQSCFHPFTAGGLTERILEPQTSISDGIPNAAYDPTSMGVVYNAARSRAGSDRERNFVNPLYQAAAMNSDTSHGNASQSNGDIDSSSGLYATIDSGSPRRSWALRPPESGQYSVVT